MRFEIVVASPPVVREPNDTEGGVSTPLPGEVRALPAVVRPPREAVTAPRPAPALPAAAGLRVAPRTPRRQGPAVLDVFIDGANVTARLREAHGAFVLRDMALALADLAGRGRAKALVRFYDEPWEMCVERFGATACVSVYRTGPDPQVAVYDRAVPFDDVVEGVCDAIDRLLERGAGGAAARRELASAAEQLRSRRFDAAPDSPEGVPDPMPVVVEPERDVPLSFGAEFSMRHGAPLVSATDGADGEPVERADLHALLVRGHVRAEVRGRAIDLGECHPLLVAERLVELARSAFDAWERGVAFHTRVDVAGVLVGVRTSSDGELALTLGASRAAGDGPQPRPVHTFPALGASDLLDAALAFGRGLVRAMLRRDRAQAYNLRLRPLRRALRDATESLREASRTESKVNAAPEPYRAFAAALDEARALPPSNPPATRVRYASRWRAIVPGIDLRATFLCGDRLIVGSATEMWALDRVSGNVLWRTDVPRGTSVVTPGGVARFAADGTMRVHDLATGEATLRTRISARVGGPVAGAVVHLPGLPKLVIVTEGAHHLVAIDLTSGEPRWRWSWGQGAQAGGRGRGIPRIKRAGRLAYFTCGDSSLTALDVMTGAVVWRLRDRLRFRTPPTVAPDALFAIAGGAHGVARLHAIDPFAGRVRWSTEVGGVNAPCTIQGAPIVATGAVAVPVLHKSGLALAAFSRDAGAPVAGPARVMAPSGTSWLGVDDAFIGNAPTGELLAIDATHGELRWRQVLGPCPVEADVPRRLEPVLRGGALFVPHTDVVVVRPRDGAVLGAISPTEAIPDLLRVDERCDVYIAEESGHLVAFGAMARLSLVKS
ncbi:MAG TPA: PQQ-binding-like beta-propeller repeat protein [Polyangiaceae bacterium]|jgi:outer membrane protein assembly factor BamB